MSHRPRKHFGQNFLQSSSTIDAILKAIRPSSSDNLIEIGPGQGALTKPLLKHVDHLTVIEIDKDLHPIIQALPGASEKLTLIDADALKIDYGQLGQDLKVVGNLPYNISTPLIIQLLHHAYHIQDMIFMLQKEVVERLVAAPGSKDFGRLSVMVQYYCQTELLFTVPPEVFYPKPKVDSAVVRLTPYEKSPYPNIDFKLLEDVVRQAFSMRRKTLANNLKKWMTAGDIESINIDPRQRPEQISIKDYVQIAKFITK